MYYFKPSLLDAELIISLCALKSVCKLFKKNQLVWIERNLSWLCNFKKKIQTHARVAWNWSYTNAWLCQFKFGWKSNFLELPSYILSDIYKDIDKANVIGKAMFDILHTVSLTRCCIISTNCKVVCLST